MQENASAHEELINDTTRREFEMIGNLISSCCAETMRLRESSGLVRSGKEFRTKRSFLFEKAYVIGRKIDLDKRVSISDYTRNGSGSFATQHTVRGHFKRQPYGPGRSESKIIHIAPYPRGPKDAPFAVRAHGLSGRTSAEIPKERP